jgi:hypothetical protein
MLKTMQENGQKAIDDFNQNSKHAQSNGGEFQASLLKGRIVIYRGGSREINLSGPVQEERHGL